MGKVLVELVAILQVPLGLILGGALGGAARCIVDKDNCDDKSYREVIALGVIASLAGVYVLPFPIPEHLKAFDFLKLVSFGIIAGLMGEILLGRVRDAMFPDSKSRRRAERKTKTMSKFAAEFKYLGGK